MPTPGSLAEQVASGLTNKLQVQSSRKLELRQGRNEITEESSKIVPLGAPLNLEISISWRNDLCRTSVSICVFGNTWEQLFVE
jgi:hypothetical protein